MAVTTALALVVPVSSLAQGATPTTKRVSVRSNGTQADSELADLTTSRQSTSPSRAAFTMASVRDFASSRQYRR